MLLSCLLYSRTSTTTSSADSTNRPLSKTFSATFNCTTFEVPFWDEHLGCVEWMSHECGLAYAHKFTIRLHADRIHQFAVEGVRNAFLRVFLHAQVSVHITHALYGWVHMTFGSAPEQSRLRAASPGICPARQPTCRRCKNLISGWFVRLISK